MTKNLFTIALSLMVVGAYAQKKSTLPLSELKKRVTKHNTELRSAAKTTAVYWRLAAYANYRDMGGGLTLSDSARYIYSNARGSSFDYYYMEYDDYGVDPELNIIKADTCYIYSDNNSTFGLSDVYFSSFNSNGHATEFTQKSGQPLSNNYKETGAYNANHDLTVVEELNWNTGTSQWDKSYADFYSYDANNRNTSDSSYDYDFAQPDLKGVFTYDANGNLDSIVYYDWNGATWEPNYAAKNHYDANNREVMAVNYQFINGTQKYHSKDITTYTGNSTMYTTYTYIIWDTTAKKWVNDNMDSSTFNSNGLPATNLSYTWDVMNSNWVAEQESEYSYNANGDIIEEKTYPYTNGTKSANYTNRYIYYYEVYFDVSVPNTDATTKINIYPNPATTNIYVVLNEGQKGMITLTNMAGQTVRSLNTAGNRKVAVDIAGLACGNYILSVEGDGIPATRQMLTIQ